MNQESIDNKADEVGLIKCTSGKYCDFCDSPKDGIFERTGGYEYHDDGYSICGFCLMKISCEFPFLAEINLGSKIDQLQEQLPIKLPF